MLPLICNRFVNVALQTIGSVRKICFNFPLPNFNEPFAPAQRLFNFSLSSKEIYAKTKEWDIFSYRQLPKIFR